MLPTRPRLESRSMCSSCTAPCSVTATRVSCGVTFMRICSFISANALRRLTQMNADEAQMDVLQLRSRDYPVIVAQLPSIGVRSSALHLRFQSFLSPLGYDNSEFAEELGGFVERQAHHARVAALDPFDEGAGASLDAIGARLVE